MIGLLKIVSNIISFRRIKHTTDFRFLRGYEGIRVSFRSHIRIKWFNLLHLYVLRRYASTHHFLISFWKEQIYATNEQKKKEEWRSFFLNIINRKNTTNCVALPSWLQAKFRSVVIECPKYMSKRSGLKAMISWKSLSALLGEIGWQQA